jgi:hypothetical protein
MVLIVVSDLSEEVNLLEEMLKALFVIADDDSDGDIVGAFGVLLELLDPDIDFEEEVIVDPEETMVAACRELKTETMEEATADVLTEEAED